MKKIFNNALICTEGNETKSCHIIVEDGIITDVYEGNDPILMLSHTIDIVDLGGMLVVPAGVDPHVHFNDPGFTERETYETGTKAAIRGGVTTVIDMPCTSLPPVITLGGFVKRIEALRRYDYCNVALRGGVSEKSFSRILGKDMSRLYSEGVASFKVYLISGMESFKQLSPKQIEETLEIAKIIGTQVDCHCEDPEIINNLTKKYHSCEDVLSYAKSRPVEAEVRGIRTFLDLLKKTKARGHIVHVSSGEGASLIKQYKEEGVDVTFETCPHYLAFIQKDFLTLGSSLKTAPPVKFEEDREALWEMLIDDTIDFVATDHAPAPPEMKNTGSIWTDYSGIPGLETFMDYLYNEGVVKNKITLERFIEITSYNAAKRYKLKNLGRIKSGYYADFSIIDPNKERIVKGENFYSKGKITPFEGMKFKGSVVKTFIRGEEVWSVDKGVIEPPKGKFLKSGR